MNTTLFTQRLQECRRRKFSSQQAFADAYMERFGMIRDIKKNKEHNINACKNHAGANIENGI